MRQQDIWSNKKKSWKNISELDGHTEKVATLVTGAQYGEL